MKMKTHLAYVALLLFVEDVIVVAGDSSSIVAEAGGVKMTREEFERRNAGKLFQARNAYYETERKALDEFIDEKLLEQQAGRENLSVEELLNRHVVNKLPPDPTDDALRVYFEGVDTTEPFEAVRNKIIDHLRQRRMARLKSAYLQSLRDQAGITVSIQAPRAQVPMAAGTAIRGPKDASVLIVEYADYECPFCQQVQPALEKVLAEYGDRVAFSYRDAPLPMHANAQKAAEAKHCAGNQGKFWEFHDRLASSKQIQIGNLQEIAQALQLDMPTFTSCITQGEKAGAVRAQLEEAQALGLQGTPSFFINGRFFSGVLTYEKFRDIVEEELQEAAIQPTSAKR
jgi:protein-disulfide isomerase